MEQNRPVMPPQTHRHATILERDGTKMAMPTDYWIAAIFDVLHPDQQEQIMERVKALYEESQNKPRIAVPSLVPPNGIH